MINTSSSSSNEEDAPLLAGQKKNHDFIKKVSPWYIILPLFVLTFCFSALYAPIIQFYSVVFCYRYYQQQLGNIDIDIPFEKCTIPEVQAVVSKAQAIIVLLGYGSTMLFADYYGTLSDRKGRRLVFIISGFGNAILILSYIVTIKYTNIFGVSLLFIAPVMRGILAGDAVLFATAHAYISDCTTPLERTTLFGNMMGVVFLGATLGPSAASFIMKETNSITTILLLVLIANIAFILYTWLFLPESNRNCGNETSVTHKEQQTLLQRLNIFSVLSIFYKTSSKNTKGFTLPIIACIDFLYNIVALPPAILYAMLSFGWTAYEGGIYVSLTSFTRLISMLLVLPLLSKFFKAEKTTEGQEDERTKLRPKNSNSSSFILYVEEASSFHTEGEQQENDDNETKYEELSDEVSDNSIRFDSWLICTGLIIDTICLVLYALAQNTSTFMMAGALQSFALLTSPSLRSIMTRLVPRSEVGRLFGALAILESLSGKFYMCIYICI
ncbi:major facilitator superfamily domain-containing protein [Cokeromyces recurvatus]|uniref:major facilitator superfamily domain-containing protein n=1 Tax=Cokeromyces recurvatus TaxID=90255 RepID=UPI002220693C|nr:major facilitator superfamily domain-containing protein [Cokeromyces recurvatus]KAI7907133.1 major facilitator superfamily domain-containing protein [Cokeromyces recurvatus]